MSETFSTTPKNLGQLLFQQADIDKSKQRQNPQKPEDIKEKAFRKFIQSEDTFRKLKGEEPPYPSDD